MLAQGQVVDNNDPVGRGRIRVRIPGIMEDTNNDITSLPWIDGNTISASNDAGSFIVPPVGSWVNLLSTGDYYIYLGTWNSSQDKPKEATSTTMKVIYKSELGHTILVDDTPEQEKVRIIDRAGQIIEMSCPLTKRGSDINRRGIGNVIDGDAKDIIEVKEEASIKIQDLLGNKLSLISKLNNGSVTLEDSAGYKFSIDTALQTISMLTDVGTGITIDGSTGEFIITMDTFTITADAINLNAEEIKFNAGEAGIHNETTNPIDMFTGAPQPGLPDVLAL